MIVPETEDGRLLFIINYYGHLLVGTTDEFCDATHNCEPSQEEIDFICKEIKPFIGEDYDFKGNLMSAWAGLRPLVKARADDIVEEPKENSFVDQFYSYGGSFVRWLAFKVHGSKKKKSSKAISRNHVIEVTKSGLVSLMGGKWTSYRSQGEECVDRIIKENPDKFKDSLKYTSGQTLNFNLIGAYGKSELIDNLGSNNKDELYQSYIDKFVFEYKVPRDMAQHLIKTYGTTALRIVEEGVRQENNTRLHPDFAFSEAEVIWAIRNEMAVKPNDIVCRRVPISFIDIEATRSTVLPRVVEIMAKELKWSKERTEKEMKEALEGLKSMK